MTLDLDLYLNYISALWSSLGWVHAHVHAQPLKTDTRQDCTQFSKESKNNGEDNKSQTGNENILENKRVSKYSATCGDMREEFCFVLVKTFHHRGASCSS